MFVKFNDCKTFIKADGQCKGRLSLIHDLPRGNVLSLCVFCCPGYLSGKQLLVSPDRLTV